MLTQDFLKDLDFIFDVPAGKEPKRYPLTDISYNDEAVFIDIAVAGFGPNDIDIEQEGDTLIITGIQRTEDVEEVVYVQKHISNAEFERKIKLHTDFVDGYIKASYKNGILGIKVSKKEKPKKLIEISS